VRPAIVLKDNVVTVTGRATPVWTDGTLPVANPDGATHWFGWTTADPRFWTPRLAIFHGSVFPHDAITTPFHRGFCPYHGGLRSAGLDDGQTPPTPGLAYHTYLPVNIGFPLDVVLYGQAAGGYRIAVAGFTTPATTAFTNTIQA